jgi:Arc/MetJ family transcription regulator
LRYEIAVHDADEEPAQERSVAMQINIELDDALVAEAKALTGFGTTREVVEAGLRLLARHKRQADARELFGCIRWEGDLHREHLDD